MPSHEHRGTAEWLLLGVDDLVDRSHEILGGGLDHCQANVEMIGDDASHCAFIGASFQRFGVDARELLTGCGVVLPCRQPAYG